MKLRVSYSGWGAVSVANLGDRSPSAPKARRGVVKRTVNARLGFKNSRVGRLPVPALGRNVITSLFGEISLDRLP